MLFLSLNLLLGSSSCSVISRPYSDHELEAVSGNVIWLEIIELFKHLKPIFFRLYWNWSCSIRPLFCEIITHLCLRFLLWSLWKAKKENTIYAISEDFILVIAFLSVRLNRAWSFDSKRCWTASHLASSTATEFSRISSLAWPQAKGLSIIALLRIYFNEKKNQNVSICVFY